MLHLIKRANGGLKDQVGVEEEGAEKRLRIGGQLSHDPCQQQVDMKRVREHVLQAGQQHADEWTFRKRTEC